MMDKNEQVVSVTDELTNEVELKNNVTETSITIKNEKPFKDIEGTPASQSEPEVMPNLEIKTKNEENKDDKKEQALKDKKQKVELSENGEILIEGRRYHLVENYREAFDIEQLNARYSDVLARYDFVVGDIGFEQLRLRGFFSDNQKKMPNDQRIGSLQDYLYEYCNFGCAYFVLESLDAPVPKENKPNRSKRQNRNKSKSKNQPAHIQEKQGRTHTPNVKNKTTKKSPIIKNRREREIDEEKKSRPETAPKKHNSEGKNDKRGFTIRQKSSESK
ncbi:YutD family protein [Vagococcus intermedius]|uniref:YutD family protein n=1 Tax=Vagococcus intermedius TaxID=2991418 RepID=A0AAF0I8W4_9ENTE|nr:YutD family protein [Vagococcus intermedius]WEG72917.1 YutD family protein [Vagococcus intermedius]WEG75004.1 YutD family protein [Vagococcus intermedius]